MSLERPRDNPCYESTRTPVDGKKRCPQCWQIKPHPTGFIGRRGRPIQICNACSDRRAVYLKEYRL